MPAAANGAAGTDGELIVIDGDVAYNFWQFKRTSATTGSAASFGSENVVSGDGWGSKSPFLSAGITAAGASQLGGLIVKDETADGSIDHALQLAVDFKLAKPGAVGQAISSDGSSSTGIVQEGQLLAIPPGTPMPSGLSALGQQVFKAMQTYGAYVIDVAGGTTNVRAQSNAFDNATMTALWHDMGNITPLLQGVTNNSSSGGVTPPPVVTPPVVTTPPPVTTPPVVTTPPPVTTPPVVTTPPPVTTPPVVTTPPPVTTPPVVTTPPPVTTPPVVTTPPPVTTPPTVPTTPVADTTKPTLDWIAANGAGIVNGSGIVGVGDTVQLALKFSEMVNVSGTPTLSLNDKGIANYVSGAGTDVLQFEYLVAAGQNTADLAINGFGLSGVKDLAGNALNLSGAPRQPAGTLVVDTAASTNTGPKVQWIATSGSGISNGSGTVGTGGTVRLSVNFSDVMTVNGSPTLSLNSNGTAKYVGGSGTSTLQFDYKVGSGERASDLEVSGYNMSGVRDRVGNTVNLAGAPHQPAGTLAIRSTAMGTTSSNLMTTASVTDLAAPVAPDAGTSAFGGSWFGNGAQSSNGMGLAFGNPRTVGYSGQDGSTSSSPSAGSVAPTLALLSQYSASSFATAAPTSTGVLASGWMGDPAQTLAKSRA